ncbi:MAG: hypothetical protein ACRD1P_07750 [Thermoanaerobaculia bacterium]
MLKVDREHRTFARLDAPTLANARILERADLQECIYNSSSEFFAEIGERVFVLGREVIPSQTVPDRIDLLGIDAEGTTVIVELKRGSNKLQMLQAVSYAGMVSRWGVEDFRGLVSADDWEALTDFLDVDIDEINRNQRLLLVAEGYDYALLAGAEWLSERYGVDIRCSAVALATDSATGAEYLACSSVFPPPALAEQAAARSRSPRSLRPIKWADWDEALASLANEELREFARKELESGRESSLRRRVFHYRIDGKRRWSMVCRKKAAYVWQRGRFKEDEDFWKDRLGEAASVSSVKSGAALSFNLNTTSELHAFREAVTQGLKDARWSESIGAPGDEVDDEIEVD